MLVKMLFPLLARCGKRWISTAGQRSWVMRVRAKLKKQMEQSDTGRWGLGFSASINVTAAVHQSRAFGL
jgi:hypothetical protein